MKVHVQIDECDVSMEIDTDASVSIMSEGTHISIWPTKELNVSNIAKIEVDLQATPRFCKARTLPYAMRSKVEEELDRLLAEGIVEPEEYADWVAPVVAVLKSNYKNVCLCGDFCMTVAKLHRHPIPRVDDLFTTLQGGKKFTKLDLSQAYQQLPLHPDSRKDVVINTHKGLHQYT